MVNIIHGLLFTCAIVILYIYALRSHMRGIRHGEGMVPGHGHVTDQKISISCATPLGECKVRIQWNPSIRTPLKCGRLL